MNAKLLLLGILAAALGAIWLLLSALSPFALKALSTLVLASLPVAFILGWAFGRRETKMFLDGLDRGTDKVITAGGKVADLRASKVTQARQAARPEIKLPQATQLEVVEVSSQDSGAIEL